MSASTAIAITTEWEETIAAIAKAPGTVLVLGASDTGKTTWISFAAARLVETETLPLGVVDADLGQATMGPPATIALSLLREKPSDLLVLKDFTPEALSFVGAISPVGHLLPTLVATKRLVDRARSLNAQTILVDTTGLITSGVGFQLKLRKCELLNPAHLVAFQHRNELESLISVVSGHTDLYVHRLAISPSVRTRSPGERSDYRAHRFATYFACATSMELAASQIIILAPPSSRFRQTPDHAADVWSPLLFSKFEHVNGLVVGLNDAENLTLGLGILEAVSLDGHTIRVRTPLTDSSAVRLLQLGSFRLTGSWEEA